MKRNTEARLINVGGRDLNTLTDYWITVAENVENALLEIGAIPGQDYTRLDLIKLASPFCRCAWDEGILEMTAEGEITGPPSQPIKRREVLEEEVL
jgi:hypothetical protein